jgi:anhydro-N-acetylmuramic acid kinase
LPRWPDEIIVSGGGTKNPRLMKEIVEAMRFPHLSPRSVPVRTLEDMGMCSAAKEAIAFALLGAATLDGIPSNIPSATGARRAVTLGSITPRPH